VNRVDVNGEDIYMLFYTTSEKMFKASAETRKREIESMLGFNSEKDKVIMFAIKDLGQIEELVNAAINDYSEQYGKTAEVGFWTHSGWDGPMGDVSTSGEYSLPPYNQMQTEGWNNINFNWKEEGANISFYGCNTGNEIREGKWTGSFARKISAQNNFRGVNVWGQRTSSFPSFSPYYRATNFGRTIGYSYNGGNTYMVGGNAHQGKQAFWFTSGEYPKANLMNVYRNGKLVRSAYQNR
jgi:hypothetical protein